MNRNPLDRRTFAKRVAGSAVAMGSVLAGSATSQGADQKEPPKPQPDPAKAEAPAPLSSMPPEELLLALVRQKYPHEFSDEQLSAIQGQLSWYWARSALLSRFPLTNADEPAPVFAAYRE